MFADDANGNTDPNAATDPTSLAVARKRTQSRIQPNINCHFVTLREHARFRSARDMPISGKPEIGGRPGMTTPTGVGDATPPVTS
jgi:hypothetical protein